MVITENLKNILKDCFFLCALSLSCVNAYADDDDEIIEYQGDRYVIHVNRMNPDSEMTLMDVLNTCPEFLSLNGKTIELDYSLRVDNIGVIVDSESFLRNVKACEIDRIQICSNSSVAKSVGGTTGVIDVYYREDVKTDGKVAAAGSTYGNGMAYADVTNRSEKLTVQAYAMARTSYGRANPTDVFRMTDRGLAENLHLNLDWKMSKSDRLIIKAFQKFGNSKKKYVNPKPMDDPLRCRCVPNGAPTSAKTRLARGMAKRMNISVQQWAVDCFCRSKIRIYPRNSPNVISSTSFCSQLISLGVVLMGITCLLNSALLTTPSFSFIVYTLPFLKTHLLSSHLAVFAVCILLSFLL